MDDGRSPSDTTYSLAQQAISEADLEEALIGELQQFLLDWGTILRSSPGKGVFASAPNGYRVDFLFFHRRLRSVIELKLDKFSHADAGQNESVFELRSRTLDESR